MIVVFAKLPPLLAIKDAGMDVEEGLRLTYLDYVRRKEEGGIEAMEKRLEEQIRIAEEEKKIEAFAQKRETLENLKKEREEKRFADK